MRKEIDKPPPTTDSPLDPIGQALAALKPSSATSSAAATKTDQPGGILGQVLATLNASKRQSQEPPRKAREIQTQTEQLTPVGNVFE